MRNRGLAVYEGLEGLEMFPRPFAKKTDADSLYWDTALRIKDDAMGAWEDFCDGLMALRLARFNQQQWVAYMAAERDNFMSWENPEWFLSNSP